MDSIGLQCNYWCSWLFLPSVGDRIFNTQLNTLLGILFKDDTEGAFVQLKVWQSASIAVVKIREANTTKHCTGSKSFARYRYEMRKPEIDEEAGQIEYNAELVEAMMRANEAEKRNKKLEERIEEQQHTIDGLTADTMDFKLLS